MQSGEEAFTPQQLCDKMYPVHWPCGMNKTVLPAFFAFKCHHWIVYTLEVNTQQYTCPVVYIRKTCLTVSSTSSFSLVVGEQVYVHVQWICRYDSA